MSLTATTAVNGGDVANTERVLNTERCLVGVMDADASASRYESTIVSEVTVAHKLVELLASHAADFRRTGIGNVGTRNWVGLGGSCCTQRFRWFSGGRLGRVIRRFGNWWLRGRVRTGLNAMLLMLEAGYNSPSL